MLQAGLDTKGLLNCGMIGLHKKMCDYKKTNIRIL